MTNYFIRETFFLSINKSTSHTLNFYYHFPLFYFIIISLIIRKLFFFDKWSNICSPIRNVVFAISRVYFVKHSNPNPTINCSIVKEIKKCVDRDNTDPLSAVSPSIPHSFVQLKVQLIIFHDVQTWFGVGWSIVWGLLFTHGWIWILQDNTV